MVIRSDKCIYLDYSYALGGSKTHYTEIPGYLDVMKSYGMPNVPSIWGLKYFYECKMAASDFIRDTLMKNISTLESVSANDAVVLCCPNTYAHSVFYEATINALNSIECQPGILLPLSFLGCTSVLAATDIAMGLPSRFENVIIISSEILEDPNVRMTNFAIYSDHVGIFRLSHTKISDYRVVAAGSKVVLEDISSGGVSAYDKANIQNFNAFGIAPSDIKMILGMNLFKPISGAVYKKLGFSAEQFSLDNIDSHAHCGGVDPFVGLSENKHRFQSDDFIMLNCQGNGRSSIVQLQYSV